MAGVPAINMPYVAPVSRKVDGLPPDPLAIQADLVQAGRLVPAISLRELDTATAPASPALLKSFLMATCAILPGEHEDTIQQLERPKFTRPVIENLIAKHSRNRFNTSDTNNFNCLLKELITHHDFMVDVHNYALISNTQLLIELEGETWEQQAERLEAAHDFRTARFDALQRLDVLFESRRGMVHEFMEEDEVMGEIGRLNTIHQKLKEEPAFLAQSYNTVHDYPPLKLHFAEMDNETKWVL